MQTKHLLSLLAVLGIQIPVIALACNLPDGFTAITSAAELRAIRTCFPDTSCPSDDNGPYNDRRYMVMNNIDLSSGFSPIVTEFRGRLIGCEENPPILSRFRQVSTVSGYGGIFLDVAGSAEIRDLVIEDFEVSIPGNASSLSAQIVGNVRINNIDFRRSALSAIASVQSRGSGSTPGNAGLLASFVENGDATTGCSSSPGSLACNRISEIDIVSPADAPDSSRYVQVEAVRGNAGGLVARMGEGIIADVQGSLKVRGHEFASGLAATLFPDPGVGARLEDVRLNVDVETADYLASSCRENLGLACGSAGGIVGASLGPVHVIRSGVHGRVAAHEYAGGILGEDHDTGSNVVNTFNMASVQQVMSGTGVPSDTGGAGGLVGHGSGAIEHSYAVTSQLTSSSGRRGGLGFDGSMSAMSSYYDAELAQVSSSNVGVGLSTLEMQTPPANSSSLFGDWDAGLWSFEAGQYPHLNAVFYCGADYNQDGFVSVQDIFDLLSGFFANDPRADINNNGGVTVQDIFEFLAMWFAAMNSGQC